MLACGRGAGCEFSSALIRRQGERGMSDANGFSRDLLLSVRPIYAEKIVRGAKTVELRRRFPVTVGSGSIVLIYATSPERAIVGRARVGSINRMPLATLWREHGNAACVEREDFDDYFNGLATGIAILLTDVARFRSALPAVELLKRFGFRPPQSFMYLRREHHPLLKHERPKTLN